MTFEEAWQDLPMGQRVRVSNGQPEPPGDGIAHRIWLSHNCEGTAADKLAGPPRAIRVQLDPQEGARVAFDISELSGDTFEIV